MCVRHKNLDILSNRPINAIVTLSGNEISGNITHDDRGGDNRAVGHPAMLLVICAVVSD